MNVRFADNYTDAKEMLEDSLNSVEKIAIRKYNNILANICTINSFELTPVAVDSLDGLDIYANLDLTLTYSEATITYGKEFVTVDRVENLRLFSTIGDNSWNHAMIGKIWDGNYPSTIALNVETGLIYLVNITAGALEFVIFGKLSKEDLSIYMANWFEREPFAIKLDAKAMFEYIGGTEGTKYLKENVYIELKSGVGAICVYPHKQKTITNTSQNIEDEDDK